MWEFFSVVALDDEDLFYFLFTFVMIVVNQNLQDVIIVVGLIGLEVFGEGGWVDSDEEFDEHLFFGNIGISGELLCEDAADKSVEDIGHWLFLIVGFVKIHMFFG